MSLVHRQSEPAFEAFERFASADNLHALSTFALVNLARVLVHKSDASALTALRIAFEQQQEEAVSSSLFAQLPLSLLRAILDEYPAVQVHSALASPLLAAITSHELSDVRDWSNLWHLLKVLVARTIIH